MAVAIDGVKAVTSKTITESVGERNDIIAVSMPAN
jgi:hypothetical protein